MEGLTIDNNNNDNIPKALRKSIETSEKLQEKFSPILEQEKKMQQLVEGVNIPKFEVSTQALDAMRNITDNTMKTEMKFLANTARCLSRSILTCLMNM